MRDTTKLPQIKQIKVESGREEKLKGGGTSAGSFGAGGGFFVRFRAFGGSWRSAFSRPPPLLHICILAYLPLSQKIASMARPSTTISIDLGR